MKQLLDETITRHLRPLGGGFVLHTVLLLVATFLIGFEVKCPWYYWAAWKGSGVFCLFLWDFIGKQALFAENFPCF